MSARFPATCGVGKLGMLALGAVSVVAWPSNLRADAKSDYEMLFGKEDRAASASRTTADDAALAGKLLEAAKTARDASDLKRLLCRKAHAFGLKNRAGYTAALEAVKLLERTFPDERPQCREMRLEVLALRYRWVPRSERRVAGEDYLRALLACAEARESAGRQEEAAALYAKACSIAQYNRSGLLEEIAARRKELTQRIATEARTRVRVRTLSEALEKDPTDVRAREDLIRCHLLELDDPAAAKKLVNTSVSELLRTCVPLAARPIEETPQAQCLELAKWYRQLAAQAPQAHRERPLVRARWYLQRFLRLRDAEDVKTLQARLILKAVMADLNRLGAACVGTAKWFQRLRRLFENGAFAMTDRVRGGGGNLFVETAREGGLLIGLKVTCHMYSIHRTIGSVQPIFLTAEGRVEGKIHGKASGEVRAVEAKPGYAVGAIHGIGGHRIDGFKVIFMGIGTRGLDPTKRYESEWLGGNKGREDTKLAGDGGFVIGIIGTQGAQVHSLGLVQVKSTGLWEGAGALDLTEFPPSSVTVGWRSLTVSRPICDDGEKGPNIDGKPVKPYLGASARSAIVYRLPLGAGGRRLLPRGWMAQPDSRNGVKFIVRIDGKKVYQSRTVNITDPWVDIDVRIPVGAKVLELAVDDLGDKGGDRSYWVRPRIE